MTKFQKAAAEIVNKYRSTKLPPPRPLTERERAMIRQKLGGYYITVQASSAPLMSNEELANEIAELRYQNRKLAIKLGY